jgi:ATP-binding cassette subfamily B protein
VVPQVVQLFSGTVFENLTLGDSSLSEEAVFEAATIAGVDAFVRSLPMGYQTFLGHRSDARGTQLSAGQQQLLALARALVHRPAVLLLDEATAAIDGISDAAFRAALRRSVLPAGCAVLTVAHRLSTAVEADRVIVFERGVIVEEGTSWSSRRQAGTGDRAPELGGPSPAPPTYRLTRVRASRTRSAGCCERRRSPRTRPSSR